MYLIYIFCIVSLVVILISPSILAKDAAVVEPSYAWTISEPLGLRYTSTIDTLQYNYFQQAIPSMASKAYATTGNLGAEGQDQIFFDRPAISNFFFEDALSVYLPSIKTQKFYNTRIPMTILSYNTGGTSDNTQDRLSAVFSGNVNKAIEVGAAMDYIYSKGLYDGQSTSDFTWRVFGSYTGDRYELQAFFNSYNFLNKENGGITDDRYITDPAQVQGGSTTVNTKTVPTNLTDAHSRIYGTELYLNHRYKVGYYENHRDPETDTIIGRTYIPVTSFIWTMNYKSNKHLFLSTAETDTSYFDNSYFTLQGTNDETSYWKLSNTLGISMLEGFNKYAKFGLAAYVTHEFRKYTQHTDTIESISAESGLLTPLPGYTIPHTYTENLIWVGGQLTKQRGSILTYNATAQFGIVGSVAGDIDVSGDISTKFKLKNDSVRITGYGYFKNKEVPYFIQNYISNHYIWQNDFGKERRIRFGGRLVFPLTRTKADVGVENIQNFIYFNNSGLPAQHGDNIQVFSATVDQNFKFGIFNWNNSLTYQTSSNETVLPLPKFAIYSNMFLQFPIARVLHVQFGVDCNYYTRYYAPAYNPATMTFHTQNEVMCGNFAFMTVYANMKLKKTRFFVMFSHVNESFMGGSFAIPHYPLNGMKFQMGLSVDFAN